MVVLSQSPHSQPSPSPVWWPDCSSSRSSGRRRCRGRSRRCLFLRTAPRINCAALSGVVRVNFSKSSAASSASTASSCSEDSKRAFLAISVRMPPGWMVVAETPHRSMSSLGANCVGEPAHHELGGVVGRPAGDAEEAERAGDVDHVAVAGRLQTASRSVTSTRAEVTFTLLLRPTDCSTSATVSARPSSSTSLSARWEPQCANWRAIPLPMPDSAPVIAATS